MTGFAEEVRWVQTWDDPPGGAFRVGRSKDRLVAEWASLATLRASRDGRQVELEVVPGCSPRWVEKLRNGQAAALLRHLEGGMTLHASGVAVGTSGVVFLGESGAGKSTLAASFCERGGADLVTDDTAALVFDGGAVRLLAGERDIWLSPASHGALGRDVPAGHKSPFRPARAVVESADLHAMIHLVFEDGASGVDLRRVEGRDAFVILSRSLFRFVVDEHEVWVRDLENLERLASRVPLYELRRPRTLGALDAALAVVRDSLEAEAG